MDDIHSVHTYLSTLGDLPLAVTRIWSCVRVQLDSTTSNIVVAMCGNENGTPNNQKGTIEESHSVDTSMIM
jgi:hypothetical protein